MAVLHRFYCKSYFTGSIIDRCEQMSECVNVDCGNNGYCISYDNGYHYKCKCNIGYAGVTCDYNVDDCLGRPCKNEASCVDGIDDYSCLCIHEGTGGKVFYLSYPNKILTFPYDDYCF